MDMNRNSVLPRRHLSKIVVRLVYTYVKRYSKRYLKSLPLVSDLQLLEAN